MPDRIPLFSEQVAVLDAGSFRPILPDVADAGGELNRLGRSMLQAAEPFYEKKAIEAANEAAPVARIAKDEQGVYTRPAPPKGAGVAYLERYNQILDKRELGLYAADFEAKLGELRRDFQYDPHGFNNVANGWARGVLEQANPRVRDELESYMLREIVQASNDVWAKTDAREKRLTVNLAEAQIKDSLAKIDNYRSLGTPEGLEMARAEFARLEEAYQAIVDIGEMSDEQVAFEVSAVANRAAPLLRRADQAIAVGPLMAQARDWEGADAADMLEVMAGADFGDRKIMGRTSREWHALITDPQVRLDVAQAAARRISVLNRASEADADKILEAAIRGLEEAVREGNADPAGGFNRQEVAAQDAQFFETHGSTHQAMQDKAKGWQGIYDFTARTGRPPEGLADYIKQNIRGAGIHDIATFLMKYKEVAKANGVPSGMQFFREELPADARARVEFYWSLSRMGVPPDERQRLLDGVDDKSTVPAYELRNRFPNYESKRDKTITAAFRLPAGVVRNLPVATADFDNMVAAGLVYHKGDLDAAIGMAARHFGRFWHANNALFLHGLAPKEMSQPLVGLSKGDLDKAFGLGGSRYAGATFANAGKPGKPYAVFAPVEFDPDNGKIEDVYIVTFDAEGDPAGTQRVSVAEVLRRAQKTRADQRVAEGRAAIANARQQQQRFERQLPASTPAERNRPVGARVRRRREGR